MFGVRVPSVADDPFVAGGLLGVALGVLERFLVHFELTTLAVGLGVVGAVIAGFGVLLVALAAVGYEVSGATDGALYAAIGLIGGLSAVVAGLRALLTLFGGPPPATTDESSPAE